MGLQALQDCVHSHTRFLVLHRAKAIETRCGLPGYSGLFSAFPSENFDTADIRTMPATALLLTSSKEKESPPKKGEKKAREETLISLK